MNEEHYSVQGFRAAGIVAGIKRSGNRDICLIVSDRDCSATGVFTSNRFAAAPVILSQEHLASNPAAIRAVVINSGNANACTGDRGAEDARRMAEEVAAQCGIKPSQVLVASTGIIGELLPIEQVTRGIEQGAESLHEFGWGLAAQAIMTTDTVPKCISRSFETSEGRITLLGIVKGSGMIHPNMATLLGCIVTDAAVEPDALKAALGNAVKRTFNRLTVDGDTSTNDTLFLLANGAAGNELITEDSDMFEAFQYELYALCEDLVRRLAADGEGATKIVHVHVEGGKTEHDAAVIAEAIARSLLVKTAIFGNDPNWGRIVCAIGYSNADFNPDGVSVRIGPHWVFQDGMPADFEAGEVSRYLKENTEIMLLVTLRDGDASADFWTCDISYDYVKINADYHT
jgi:glutamate N-acetyltransferase/amino-acid N-acetyltransferase